MTLPNYFWEQLPLKTNAELFDMLAHQADYLPEALTAAREELRQRNLPPESVSQLESKVQAQMEADTARAHERLGWPMRIFLFIFCAVGIGLLAAAYYQSKGNHKKSWDCLVTTFASVLFYMAVAALTQFR